LAVLVFVSSVAHSQDAPKPQEGDASQEATPKFPAQVEQVTVDVVVTDKKGNPITGLTAADFTVTEDGVTQPIASFEAVQLPAAPSETPPEKPRVSTNFDHSGRVGRTFVLVFDDVHMTRANAHRAKAAVSEFLKKGVREGDRVTLVATGGDAWWTTRMEAGREELITLLKRLEGRHIPDTSPERMSDYEAMRIHIYNDPQVSERVGRRFESLGLSQVDPGTRSALDGNRNPFIWARASDVYFQSVSRTRITLGLLERVLLSLASAKGRKSVILVSDGFIYDPNLDDFKTVVQASRRANAAIYYVAAGGLEGVPYLSAEFGPPIDERDLGSALLDNTLAGEGSESVASDSGGFVVRNTNDLSRGIQRIAQESQAYYLLGYNPTNTKPDGRFRKIEVKVARKGIELRARKGYYAPLEGKAPPKKPSNVDPDIQQALDSPYEISQVPIRMTAYVFDETFLGKANTVVVAELDVKDFSFQEQDGRLIDAVEFLMVTAHRETGEYFRYDQKVEMKLLPATRDKLKETWFGIARDFELAPGGYQAKIVVREKNTGRLGTVIHDFQVPDLSQFRTSSVMLSDTLQSNPQDKNAPPRPAMLARRTFPAGGQLFSQFAVFGAEKDKQTGMPKVSAGYEIRSADGVVRGNMAPSLIKPTSLGKLSRIAGNSLEGFAPGNYEFVLTVKDEIAGKSVEVREPFTLLDAPPAPTASN
jgi:VWFA-related protein